MRRCGARSWPRPRTRDRSRVAFRRSRRSRDRAARQVAHTTAKGGVIAMTKSLAAEGARYGVRANSISPGFVSTPATDKAVDAEGKAWQVGNALIQRPGTGEDIAYMPLYLASDESSWVTGQNYSVDGGATAGWRNDS
ncbi:SDR family NAD(P)-dependent oxidoreductase, partial [Streptomyces galilaeus]|uniref:SDR family NAD(P)-dependent oxidoreductase n=3 Tax=Actinomycetes TaxID=1760 RepID=UPI0038F7D50D